MIKQWLYILPILLLLLLQSVKSSVQQSNQDLTFIPSLKSTLEIFNGTDECPPCFNCMLPGFECLHFANCSEYDRKCNCPSGFGGDDCKQPRKLNK